VAGLEKMAVWNLATKLERIKSDIGFLGTCIIGGNVARVFLWNNTIEN
jgi:hypothetical protein